MKKIRLLLVLSAVLLIAASCGKKTKNETTPSPTAVPTIPEATLTPTQEPTPTEVPEKPEKAYYGEWYAEREGVVWTLLLSEDGTYQIQSSVDKSPSDSGKWFFQDSGIALGDGTGDVLITASSEKLVWNATELAFTRKKPVVYEPAETVAEAPLTYFAGYWKSAYVDVDGMLLPAATVSDNSDIYIDGTRVALGGSLFRDAIVDMTFDNGRLTWTSEGVNIAIAAQLDGMLRATLTVQENGTTTAVTVYLTPA